MDALISLKAISDDATSNDDIFTVAADDVISEITVDDVTLSWPGRVQAGVFHELLQLAQRSCPLVKDIPK